MKKNIFLSISLTAIPKFIGGSATKGFVNKLGQEQTGIGAAIGQKYTLQCGTERQDQQPTWSWFFNGIDRSFLDNDKLACMYMVIYLHPSTHTVGSADAVRNMQQQADSMLIPALEKNNRGSIVCRVANTYGVNQRTFNLNPFCMYLLFLGAKNVAQYSFFEGFFFMP